MAAGVTAESVLGSIIQGHLECSICHTRYQEPKMLDCSHSFCLRCLQQLKKSQNPEDTKITCPLCQRETIIPEGGAEKLNTNYVLTSLVEEVTKQEQLLAGLQQSKVICQACDEENEAISRCMDCEHYLCQECQKAHQRLAVLRNHKITPLAELQGKESTPKMEPKKDASKCEAHSNHELCFYCNTCEQLICKLCAASSHKESTHTHVDLETAINIRLREARDRISEAYMCDAYNTISGSWKALRKRLSIMLEETINQICQTAEQKIKQIRQEENQLKQTAQIIYRTRDKKLAEMVVAEQTVEMVHREITDANRREILKIRQELLHDYKDVVEEQTQMTRSLSFINFKENQNEVELGALLQKEKWELLNTSQVTGDFVAAFSTGDMTIAKTPKILTKLRPDSKVLHTRNIKKFITFAVNKDDQLIVLFEPQVMIITKEYQVLRQFTPGKEAGIGSTPTCLAVDDSNMIAVGYKDKEQISLHNPDGSLIRTLPAPMIDKYLTTSKEQLIYTNGTKNKLMCVDYHGNNKFTIAVENVKYYPLITRGVCCDKAGDIYTIVSDQRFKAGGAAKAGCRYEEEYGRRRYAAIQHYSPDGKFIESISTDENLSGIAYTPDGKLVVTGAKSTQMYHRV